MKYDIRDIAARLGIAPLPGEVRVHLGVRNAAMVTVHDGGDTKVRQLREWNPATQGQEVADALGVPAALLESVEIDVRESEMARVRLCLLLDSDIGSDAILSLIADKLLVGVAS